MTSPYRESLRAPDRTLPRAPITIRVLPWMLSLFGLALFGGLAVAIGNFIAFIGFVACSSVWVAVVMSFTRALRAVSLEHAALEISVQRRAEEQTQVEAERRRQADKRASDDEERAQAEARAAADRAQAEAHFDRAWREVCAMNGKATDEATAWKVVGVRQKLVDDALDAAIAAMRRWDSAGRPRGANPLLTELVATRRACVDAHEVWLEARGVWAALRRAQTSLTEREVMQREIEALDVLEALSVEES